MKRVLVVTLLALSAAMVAGVEAGSAPHVRPTAAYGSNPAAGHTFTHDGLTLYYEVYGSGEPLLLIHGNGASIGSLAAQIDFFRKRYQVIAMDSRDHGRSDDSQEPLTYEKMADDLAALLDHLGVGPANVLGWSDGGIEALLLGMRHPDQVKKLAAMAPNLSPDEDALYPEVMQLIRALIDAVPENERDTPEGKRELKVTGMMLVEPNIAFSALEAITAPTLILVGDHDVVRTEHAVKIFEHLPNGALAVLPNATHAVPADDPAFFNGIVERFFRTPYRRDDHI